MKKIFKFFFIFLIFFSIDLLSVEIFKKDDITLNFGFKGVLWFQSFEDGSPDAKHWSKDFSLRQFRLYTNGKINNLISFGTNLDFNNLGKINGEEKTSISTSVTDSFINFSFSEKLQLITGKYRAPFSRFSLTDTYGGWVLPHGPFAASTSLLSSSNDYRHFGMTLWGFLNKKFRYNFGLSSGIPKELKDKGGDNSGSGDLQYTGRIEFTPIGEDKGYVHSNQWLGKKSKYLSFGFGYTFLRYQNKENETFYNSNYKAMVFDLYGEYPLSSGFLIFESGFYIYDRDTLSNSEIKTYFIQLGYIYKKIQPVIKIEKYRPDGIENDTKSYAFGINYYIKEHNAKIMFEYLNVENEENARIFLLSNEESGKDKSSITLGINLQI